MGVCPSLDPQLRVIQHQNYELKQILITQIKDLKIYNFHSSVTKAIQNLPTRYMYNQGILQDIEKLRFYAQRKGIQSMQSRISLFGQHMFEQQIKNSCLILQNEVASQIESQQMQKEGLKDVQVQQQEMKMNTGFQSILQKQKDTYSFQNNITRNQSLVAQMNLTYGREINKNQYSQALKLFLKWVQYFNQHSYGGFLKTIYKAFTQSLYSIDKTELQTLIDEVSIFVQIMVKVYTQIYHLQQLNKSSDGKLFKNENVYNLVMTFIFRKTKIKPFIRLVMRHNFSQKIKKFQEQLKKYSKKGVSHFGIDNKFILIRNQQWQKVLNKNKKFMKKPNTKHKNQTKNNKQRVNQGQQQQQQDIQVPQMLQSFKSRIESSCYQKSQRLVAELSSPNEGISPISKLKTIISIAKMIKQQIEEFYLKELGLSQEQIPQLDPDNLTSIIIYLIVANNNPTLFEELKMVQYFTTTNTLNCISGYYLNMFIAAIEMVSQLKL